MTASTENATPLKSTKSRNPNSSVQIETKSKSQSESVAQDIEEFEFLGLVDLSFLVWWTLRW